MISRLDIEDGIMNAEGASAVLSLLQMELMSSTAEGWRTLGLKPRDDLFVMAMSSAEYQALHYAMNDLQKQVAEVARLFYARTKE